MKKQVFRVSCVRILIVFAVLLQFFIPEARAKETGRIVVLSPRDISEFRGINEVEFIWDNIPGVSGYHIILARDRRFKDIVYENSRVPETSAVIGDLDLGTYFFKVTPVNGSGTDGGPSETLSLIVVPPPPVRTPQYLDQ